MLVSEAFSEMRLMLDDALGVYTDALLYRHLNKGLARFSQGLDDSARTTVNLVASQQEYELPAGVRTMTKVRLVPENSTSTTVELQPIRLEDVPVFTATETDPTFYYVQPTGGTNGDRFSLFVWPRPARSATDAIVIDYTPYYEMASTSESIPFPSMLHGPLVQYAAGSLLLDRNDDKDRADGNDKQQLALRDLNAFRMYQPASYLAQGTRAFP